MTDREMLDLLRDIRIFCSVRQVQALDRAIALLLPRIKPPT